MESGRQGSHDSRWGASVTHFKEGPLGHDLGVPHFGQKLQLPILQRWKLRPREETYLPRLEVWELVQCQIWLSSSSPWLPAPPQAPPCPKAVAVGAVLKTEDLLSSSQQLGLWSQTAWVQILSLPLHSCMTLGKSPGSLCPNLLTCKTGVMIAPLNYMMSLIILPTIGFLPCSFSENTYHLLARHLLH